MERKPAKERYHSSISGPQFWNSHTVNTWNLWGVCSRPWVDQIKCDISNIRTIKKQYEGKTKILMVTDEMSKEMKDYIGRAKARQETFHGRLKGTFNILGHRFRHNQKTAEKTMALHQKVVHACVVLIQYDYENGHPPLPLHWQWHLSSNRVDTFTFIFL